MTPGLPLLPAPAPEPPPPGLPSPSLLLLPPQPPPWLPLRPSQQLWRPAERPNGEGRHENEWPKDV